MSDAIDSAFDKLGAYFADQADICLAVVFGSVASGLATADSDLDVAVLATHALSAESRARLIAELAQMTGRPIDLIDLRQAGVPVARSALVSGRVEFATDDYVYPAQVSRMLIDAADFLPYRERIFKERRESWLS